MKVTFQILTKNNESTISKTLESISQSLSKDSEVIVCDIGSTDNTIPICKGFGANIIETEFNGSYSSIRNDMSKKSKNEWQFWIEPYEILIKRLPESLLKSNLPSFFNIIRDDVLTKETRMWRKSKNKFINPIFEHIDDKETSSDSKIHILSKSMSSPENAIEIIEKWKKESTSSSPFYYEACTYLGKKDYRKFIEAANMYFFREKKSNLSLIMLRYYYSGVLAFNFNDPKTAARNLLPCLSFKPLMAEFWCLLGDIYYNNLKIYKKAIEFYSNAISLGSKRLKSDRYPIHISKYKDYPNKMIESCNKVLESSTIVLR